MRGLNYAKRRLTGPAWANATSTSEPGRAGVLPVQLPGDPLAGLEASGARRAFVGEVGKQAHQVARGVGAGALHLQLAVDGERHGLCFEVDLLPVFAGGAVDEAAVHLQVGQHGEVVGGLGVDEAGLQLLDDGMATGNGRDHLCARVGLGARGQVFAQQEGDLGLQHAIAEARAGEQRAAAGHPGQRHGSEEGRGVGRARADLPASDGAEGSGDHAMNDGSLFQRLRLQFGRQVGDRLVVAACVDQQVGGFQELLHALVGHGGTSVAQMGGYVMSFSMEERRIP